MRIGRQTLCLFGLAGPLLLNGCGGGVVATIGGSVGGLVAGASLTLQNNATDNLVVSSNGPFQFAGTIESGGPYNVDVVAQPAGETCIMENGSGTVDSSGDAVSSIGVNCILSSSLGGTVSGLTAGTSVTLVNNGVPLSIASNGAFAFAGTLPTGSSYDVTVSVQPVGHTCVVPNPTGVIAADVMSTVTVNCS